MAKIGRCWNFFKKQILVYHVQLVGNDRFYIFAYFADCSRVRCQDNWLFRVGVVTRIEWRKKDENRRKNLKHCKRQFWMEIFTKNSINKWNRFENMVGRRFFLKKQITFLRHAMFGSLQVHFSKCVCCGKILPRNLLFGHQNAQSPAKLTSLFSLISGEIALNGCGERNWFGVARTCLKHMNIKIIGKTPKSNSKKVSSKFNLESRKRSKIKKPKNSFQTQFLASHSGGFGFQTVYNYKKMRIRFKQLQLHVIIENVVH